MELVDNLPMVAMFWYSAGLLSGIGAMLAARPLWTALRRAAGLRGLLLPAGGIAAFAAAAAALYLAIGSPGSLQRNKIGADVPTPHPAAVGNAGTAAGRAPQSMEDAAAGLAARLQRQGGTADEWNLLAKSYDFLGRPQEAQKARERAAAAPAGVAGTRSALRGPTAGSGAPAAASMGPTEGMLSGTSAAVLASQLDLNSKPAGTAAASAPAPAPDRAILEARVRASPGDAAALLALAEAQRSARAYEQARASYLAAIKLAGMTPQAWADYADVLGTLAGGTLGPDAGAAIEHALALDPGQSKALWLKATRAYQEHRYADAVVIWKKLRGVLPPGSQDLATIDANIAESTQLAAGLPAGAQPAATGPALPATLAGTVSIDGRLAARVRPDATLFIYAKAADSPGPPLAVLRTSPGSWPVSFRLTDEMAMIPSRRLSQYARVIVEARISRSGQATPSPGDLYVESPVISPAAGKPLALVINREIS